MTHQDALDILVKSAVKCQQNGSYSFEEAALIKQAIDVFTKPPEPAPVEQVNNEIGIKTGLQKKK